MAEATQSLQLEGENIIAKLASTFPEEQQKAMIRDVYLVTQMKSTGAGDNKRKLNINEAFTYVMTCTSLNLNPSLNHLLFLEDQLYITLQGHMHNAHATNQLRGLQTKMLATGETSYTKKGWGGKPDTQNTSKQFRYECVIQRVIDGQPAEFRAEGVADASNVTGFATELKLEQMAEARAMRRCLARAFPVGLSSFEDVQEQEAVAKAYQTNTEDAPNPLATKIANAKSMEELEALKPEITKSKSNDMVKAYANRQNELKNEIKNIDTCDENTKKLITHAHNNVTASKGKDHAVTNSELQEEVNRIESPETAETAYDRDAKIMEDVEREEKDKIQELAEEIKEEEGTL